MSLLEEIQITELEQHIKPTIEPLNHGDMVHHIDAPDTTIGVITSIIEDRAFVMWTKKIEPWEGVEARMTREICDYEDAFILAELCAESLRRSGHE